MRLTILVENNTYIDKYCLAEPAFSCWLEDGEEKILFDTGHSDLLLHNAEVLGIDLSAATKLVLSHGHSDHTGGLPALIERGILKNAEVIAHTEALYPKRVKGMDIGCPVSEEALRGACRKLTLTNDPIKVSEHVTFLGGIPRVIPFEGQIIGERETPEGWVRDDLVDDTAMALSVEGGTFVLTGCSHSGICNIITRALEVCGGPLTGVLGGFHLQRVNEQMQKTIDFLKEIATEEMYPCHCVCFAAKAEMYKAFPVKEVGVGLVLELQ